MQPALRTPAGLSVPSSGPAVVLAGVSKVYGDAQHPVHALRDVSLEIARGEFVVLLGPSGSGKTTLLNVVGGIEPPTSGTVTVDEQRVDAMAVERRAEFRRSHVGFIFQFFNLIPSLTASENVQLIAELRRELGDAEERTQRVLRAVGLGEFMHGYPAQLSGGQQQRVAIARALVNQPAVLLCDEPTGSLDLETGRSILQLLRRALAEAGATVVLVTHNSAIAGMADRVLRMRSGAVVDDRRVPEPIAAEAVSW